jgi:hypothetical protein
MVNDNLDIRNLLGSFIGEILPKADIALITSALYGGIMSLCGFATYELEKLPLVEALCVARNCAEPLLIFCIMFSWQSIVIGQLSHGLVGVCKVEN